MIGIHTQTYRHVALPPTNLKTLKCLCLCLLDSTRDRRWIVPIGSGKPALSKFIDSSRPAQLRSVLPIAIHSTRCRSHTRARGAVCQGRVLDAQRFKQQIASAVVADVGNASGMVDNTNESRPFVHVLDALEQGATSDGRAQPACPDLSWSEDQYESLDVRAFLASISEG